MYTSGSTGTPKGVLGSHMGLINRLAWQYKRFPYAARTINHQDDSSESLATEEEGDEGHESIAEIFIDDCVELRDDAPISLMSDAVDHLEGQVGGEREGEGNEKRNETEFKSDETMSSSTNANDDQIVDEERNRIRSENRNLGPNASTPVPFRGEVVCKRTPVKLIARSPFIFFTSSLRPFSVHLSFNFLSSEVLLNFFISFIELLLCYKI